MPWSAKRLQRGNLAAALQMAYDFARARQHEADINVKPVSRRKLHEPHL